MQATMGRLQTVLKMPQVIKRNIGIMAPAFQKQDHIQKLFIDKIREFKEKSSSGKLEMAASLKQKKAQELDRIAKNIGAASEAEVTKFPAFKFTDPPVDITSQGSVKK